MAALPLPDNRVLLEELFKACSNCHDTVFRAMQRDRLRMTTLDDCLSGRISVDEFENVRRALASTPMAASDPGVPSVESLRPYMDQAHLAEAERRINFGSDAAAEGNVLMHSNPWFVRLIAAGYAAIVDGQIGRLALLAELREKLEFALRTQDESITVKPAWNATTGKLHFQGTMIRLVRAAKDARRISAILDAFHHAGWPDRINAPSNFDPQIMREAIKVLNQHLSLIRFRADGTGHGICLDVI